MGRTRRRKRRTHLGEGGGKAVTSEEKPPLTIVIGRGKLNHAQQRLVLDIRKVMEPLTATKLRTSKKTQIKDILNVAGPLGVTQLISISATELGTYMRLARLPHGPTLTYQVNEYTLASDLTNLQNRPTTGNSIEFQHSPLVVLSNFSAPAGVSETEHRHVKLAGVMFQNLFPTLDVNTVKLADCRRVVLTNFERATATIEWRHYSVTNRQKGVSKRVRRLVQGGAEMPDLSRLNDISDMLGDGGETSDSEGEDDATVDMMAAGPSKKRRRQRSSSTDADDSGPQRRALRLREIGPRMTLQLLKVEKDFMKGDVLYHRLLKRTPEELAMRKAQKTEQALLKAQRKAQQEENVARKEQAKEAKKARRKARKAAGLSESESEDDAQDEDDEDSDGTDTEYGSDPEMGDDDEANYLKEVGERPLPGEFSSSRANTKTKEAIMSAKDKDAMNVERLLKEGRGGGKEMREKRGATQGSAGSGGKPDAKTLKAVGRIHPFANPNQVLAAARRQDVKKAKLARKLQERSALKKEKDSRSDGKWVGDSYGKDWSNADVKGTKGGPGGSGGRGGGGRGKKR